MDVYRSQEGARISLHVPVLPPRVLGPASAPADFLEGDATALDVPGGPYRFEAVSVDGGRIDATSLDGSMGDDLWVTSDGAHVHFRLRPAWGVVPAGIPGMVRLTFRGVESNREIVAIARFETGPSRTLVLPSGASTSVESFYTGPSGPLHEIRVDADPLVHAGLRHGEAPSAGAPVPDAVRTAWRPLRFETWLDASAAGNVAAPPVVTVEGGASLVCWPKGERWAQFSYDPRDRAHRVNAGRHPMTIAWSVGAGRRAATHRIELSLVARDDGTIALERA